MNVGELIVCSYMCVYMHRIDNRIRQNCSSLALKIFCPSVLIFCGDKDDRMGVLNKIGVVMFEPGGRFDQSVLQTAPLRFAVLWALWFTSFFYFDGEAQNGVQSPWLVWAGAYLCVSTSFLILIEWFHEGYHLVDPRKFVETTAWLFFSGACVAIAMFGGIYAIWLPFAAGGVLCSIRTVRGIND